uniref:Serpin domain-containing protein n=1 Tax=Electrophorus electricus TaxID=8005 RepID=A0A4W4E1M8_ELEEL
MCYILNPCYDSTGVKMWGNVQCCLVVVLILSVDWTVADHHQHLHHGKDAAHPHQNGEYKPCHKLSPHNADFAFSLYKKLASHPDTQGKNIFFSPLSISMALSMLALGAKGDTHSQIFSTLDYSTLTADQVNEGYEHLLHMLDHSQDALLLEIGGAAAVQKGFKPEDKFLKDIHHFYKGEAFSVDFSTPEVAVQEFNKLIAKKTKDMITDMVKSLDAATVMMLINYMYFKGKWQEAFKVEDTSKGDFNVDENTTVSVDMMNRNGEYDFYYDQGNFTSVTMLPYNGNVSMMIVLPDQGKMEELEKHISKDHLNTLDLYMPKFSVSASSCLGDTLKEMGMVDAFSDSADFSGISKGAKLAVSEVLHKAVLSVDEQGTQAAAATTIEIMLMSALPFKTEVNRPFLVFIVEKNIRSILFMGKITDPTV